MRAYLPLSILLLATACSQESREQSSQTRQDSVAEEPAPVTADASYEARSGAARDVPTPPGISVTAAPGVAFNYRYAFRLPAQKVSAVQEQHAQACEKLGIDRCRITGMLYRLVNDRDIEAMLAFKLDPAAAREFGKQGILAVQQADGMLTESQISGEDVGSEIAAATRTTARLEEDLARVEAQLARPGLRSPERAELQAQAQQLRESIRATKAGKAQHEESLAKTPVVFRYGSGDLAPGFDNGSPIGKAVKDAGDNLEGGFAVLLVLLITLLPWALLVAFGWWAVLRLRRRFGARAAPETYAVD